MSAPASQTPAATIAKALTRISRSPKLTIGGNLFANRGGRKAPDCNRLKYQRFRINRCDAAAPPK
jgi:hypothetical protein